MRAHKSAFLGLALGALALGVTACEDKDTGVTLPPPAVAISITPAGPINLEVGQTATVNANVTGGDASTDRTVVYSSSNASVASVSGNVVTAAGPGTATITATNAANSLTASVQVIVTQDEPPPPPPPAEQPTISIKSITGAGGTNAPVNINNVFGQIDITLNVEIPPGNNIDSLTVNIGNEQVCVQRFTGGTLGGAIGAAAASAQAEIVCSVDTAEFDAATGMVRFPNGQYEVRAQLHRASGAIAASTSTTLVFNNTSHFVLTYTTSGGNAQNSGVTLAPAGSSWTTGSVTATLVPVVFTGSDDNVATATVTMNSAGGANATSAACGGTTTVPVCPAYAATATGTAGSDGIITVTFPASGTGAANVNNVEGIFTFAVSGAITTGGESGPTCVNPDPVRNPIAGCTGAGTSLFANALRLDNLAPRFVSIDMIKSDPTNRYFDGSVTFSHTAQGTAASGTDGRAVTVDWGVDDQTATFQAGAPGSLITVTSTAGLPESPTNNDYVLQVTTVDELGNSRSSYATTTNTTVTTSVSGALRFGIDLTAPTLAVTPNPDIVNGAPAAAWTFDYTDAGIGPSGFPTTGQIRLSLTRINSGGTDCEIGGSGCSRTAQTIAPLGTLAYDNGDPEEGYYILDALARDAAGNDSNVEVETGLKDTTAPLMSSIQSPLIINGGESASFNALASDFVELGLFRPFLEYGAGAWFVASPEQTIGTFGPDPLHDEATLVDAHTEFLVSVEQTDAVTNMPSGVVQMAQRVHFNLLDVAGVEEDQACNPLAVLGVNCAEQMEDITAGVAGGTTATPTSITITGMTGFTQQPPDDNSIDRSAGETTELSVETTGPSQTFAQPWDRIEFWYEDAAGAWHRIGGTVSATAFDDTNLMVRTWTHSLFTAAFAPLNATYDIVAVGITDDGARALISQVVQVTITP